MDVDVDLWRRRIREETFSQYHYEMARAIEREGNVEAAIGAYQRALSIRTDYPAAYFRLLNLLSATGRADQAQAIDAQARAVNADYPAWAWHQFAFEALDERRNRDAIAAVKEALALCPTLKADPELAQVYFAEATEAERNGQIEEANTLLLDGLKLAPDNGELWRLFGFLNLFQCRIDPARGAFANALAFRPEEVMAYNGMGLVLQVDGHLDAAARSHQRAIALIPETRPRELAASLCSATITQCARHNLGEASRAVEYALALDPSNPNVWVNRGIVALLGDRLEQAEAYLRESLSLLPDYSFAETMLALTLDALGRKDEALALHRRAISHATPGQRRFFTLFWPWAAAPLTEVYRALGAGE